MTDRLVTPGLQVDLELESGAGVQHEAVTVTQLVVAGWTGRDPAAVEKHIGELEALGVTVRLQRRSSIGWPARG